MNKAKTNEFKEKIKAVMLGHAVADALGVPVEFLSRQELKERPVTGMQGFGTYPVPAGSFSDDTSMSLAALDSLARGVLDWEGIMKNFGRWYHEDAYTPTGRMFDVGNTCSTAIENYTRHGMPLWSCAPASERANGNGSLMRIHPFVLYLYAKGELDPETVHRASMLTHAHRRAQLGCGIYAFVLRELLREPSKESVRKGLNHARIFYGREEENAHYGDLYRRIGMIGIHFGDPGRFRSFTEEDIRSGGYVVHTLEAAMYCLLTTDSYRACVLKAVNLGDDTDTVAAVAGGLAGALYGYDAIPTEWLSALQRKEYIEEMCERAYERWTDADFGDIS